MSRPVTQMQTYGTFLHDLRRANGWRLSALIGIMSIVAFTDGLSVALLLPLLSRVGIAGATNSAAAITINKMLALITPVGSGVGAILVLILLLCACQMGLNIFQGWWGAKLIHRYALGWQLRLFEAVLRSDWLFLTGRKAGELSSAIVVETGRLGGAFYYFTLLSSTVVACMIYLLIALLVTWRTTLLLVGLIVVMVLSITRFYRSSHSAGHEMGALNAELQVVVNESLSGAKIIKATASERQMLDRIAAISQKLDCVGRVRLFLPNVVRGVFEFMAFAALAVFFAYGMIPMHVAPADILIVLALFMRLFPKITNAQTLVHELNSQVPAILILRDTLQAARAKSERRTGEEGFRISTPTRLEVQHLTAGYGGAPVLNELSLALDVPGMVGIVGGSGAGKSTLVHILLGLVQPSGGSVTLGGHRMGDVALDTWRRLIGYVPQETMFFHASVAENLALTKPDAARAEVVVAARRAHAHDFIMALPQGYDTPIGDQGVLLSGGQRQRLGIARALLASPALLLMDEPTSALDPNSESEILATLSELRKSVGIVIVAHRLTTVQEADRIYVLDGGQVVESGNWSELIAQRDRFHSLAKLQQIVA
jgi:ATP-binding cassette, subfamily C, bacterial